MSAGIASDDRLLIVGNPTNYAWNKKLCFMARDALFECTDAQSNKNKFRCPDELYAYEMWCPVDFRRVQSTNRRREERDALNYDPKFIEELNRKKQTIKYSHFEQY